MPLGPFVLRITIVHERFGREVVVTASPADFVRGVVDRALDAAGFSDPGPGWRLWDGDRPLPPDETLGVLFGDRTNAIPLELRLAESRSKTSEQRESPAAAREEAGPPPQRPASPARPAPSAPPARDEAVVFDAPANERADEDDAESEGARPAPPAPAPAKRKQSPAPPSASAAAAPEPARTTEKRATIRYYSRMNPDRVYPLRVMFTRDEVEKIVKKHVEQAATGPLTIGTDAPIEIEPILPGCACHPPKFTTFVGGADQVVTFHVVPHVVGAVTGARVLVRQNHGTIAEIPLDIRVVQRTWVVLSGLSTFAVPAASAAARHFGLDFKPRDGFNPYLAAADVLFGQVNPIALTAALAAVTGVLYWYTRPKGRDTFWDMTTAPPKAGGPR